MELFSKCSIEVERFNRWIKTHYEYRRKYQPTTTRRTIDNILNFKESKFEYNQLKIVKTEPDYISKPVQYDNITIIDFGFENNYCHCLIDILPVLLYSDKYFESDLIISPLSDLMLTLIALFGLEFNKVKFLKKNEKITLKYKEESEFQITNQHRNYTMISLLKEKIEFCFNQNHHIPLNNRLIYCTRNTSSDVKNNRKMLNSNEQAIIEILKNYAESNNLVFTLFNGQENGKTMDHIKQMVLFREAKIVIGPHGGAMSNVIYLDPKNKPAVCEFCCGIHSSKQVKHGSPFSQNYNRLYSYVPGDLFCYSLIPFAHSSTDMETLLSDE